MEKGEAAGRAQGQVRTSRKAASPLKDPQYFVYKDLWPLCLIRTFPSKRGNSLRLWERSESCTGVLSLLNNLFRLRQTSPTLTIYSLQE